MSLWGLKYPKITFFDLNWPFSSQSQWNLANVWEIWFLFYETPFPLLKKQFKIKFLIRDAPLGVTLEYEKFVFSIVSWAKRKKRLKTQSSLMLSFCMCAYLISAYQKILEKRPEWGDFEYGKNGSNDFSKILHTPLFWGDLFFEKIFDPPKIHYDVIIGVQKPQKWVFWT